MTVSLVIPGRNAGRTVGPCLEAVASLLETGLLEEIVFVDDGSTDDTAEQVRGFPARLLSTGGLGPAPARNAGWRAARGSLIWFIDSDCVAEPDALPLLLAHLEDPGVVAAGGSYGNMLPDSLLACLIHEEIVERHLAMARDVDYLATFNVVVRRDALEAAGGFDERFTTAEDADLAYRLLDQGRLRFDVRSRVRHFHPTHLGRYLRSQRLHGHSRMRLYAIHPRRARGDAYSGFVDHVQPPLAVLAVALSPLLLHPATAWVAPSVAALLLLAQVPMTARLVLRTRRPRYLGFAALGWVRAFWRGAGALTGGLAALRHRLRRG